jgi:hypothetical protein
MERLKNSIHKRGFDVLNIKKKSIGRCCRNTQKTAGDFIFKFSEKNERLKF